MTDISFSASEAPEVRVDAAASCYAIEPTEWKAPHPAGRPSDLAGIGAA